MKRRFARIVCTALCCAPLLAAAQTRVEKDASPQQLFNEGKTLFEQKAFSAALVPLRAYIVRQDANGNPLSAEGNREEAAYMLACAEYETRNPQCLEVLQAFLDEYPDTPHANRVYALMASAYFFDQRYDEALAMFNSSRLDLLRNEERDDMTYRLASCYLQIGNQQEAAAWFETQRSDSSRYDADCTYPLSYIRYTQQRYDEALQGFLSLQDNRKYEALVPYYIAEIYLTQKKYDKAEIVAQNYLSAYPDQEHSAEMHRIVGSANYHYGKYQQAMKEFADYRSGCQGTPRRDALYMEGLSCYHCGVYSQVP